MEIAIRALHWSESDLLEVFLLETNAIELTRKWAPMSQQQADVYGSSSTQIMLLLTGKPEQSWPVLL